MVSEFANEYLNSQESLNTLQNKLAKAKANENISDIGSITITNDIQNLRQDAIVNRDLIFDLHVFSFTGNDFSLILSRFNNMARSTNNQDIVNDVRSQILKINELPDRPLE